MAADELEIDTDTVTSCCGGLTNCTVIVSLPPGVIVVALVADGKTRKPGARVVRCAICQAVS